MPPSDRAVATRQALMEAVVGCIQDAGWAGLSARNIANRAGLNQGLVFYHFGTLTALIVAAYDAEVDEAVATYRAALSKPRTLDELIVVAETLMSAERSGGGAVLMVQLMAQASHDPELADAARRAVRQWHGLVEEVLDRVLTGTAAEDLLDGDVLAGALVSALLGGVLVDGVCWSEDDLGSRPGLALLREAARLMDVLDGLPRPVRRMVVARLASREEGSP